MAGRPSDYDFNLASEICDKIAEGGYIIDVLESNEEYPSWTTFRRWKRNNAELQTLYINAQQDKTEVIIKSIIDVKNKALNKEIEPSVANVVMQTDKWLASKFYPKMYGTRNDVHEEIEDEENETKPKDVNVTIQIKDYSKPNESTES